MPYVSYMLPLVFAFTPMVILFFGLDTRPVRNEVSLPWVGGAGGGYGKRVGEPQPGEAWQPLDPGRRFLGDGHISWPMASRLLAEIAGWGCWLPACLLGSLAGCLDD